MNPYLVLGVGPTVTMDELKSAYRRAVRLYHPDTGRCAGDPEKFTTALEAYRTLRARLEQPAAGADPAAAKPRAPRRPYQREAGPVDEVTASMPVYDLAHVLETTDNAFVRAVAVEALAMKSQPAAVRHLLNALARMDDATKVRIVRALGKPGLHQATHQLMELVEHADPDLALESVKSLARIDAMNLGRALGRLKTGEGSLWEGLARPLMDRLGRMAQARGRADKLGRLLRGGGKVNEEQLEVALLLHKRHGLLLGQVLTRLGWIGQQDVQAALTAQKRQSRD